MGDFKELLTGLGLNLTALTNKLRAVFAFPLLSGKLVSVTLVSGATTATAYHGLERAYRGGFVVNSSTALALTVDPPTATDAAQKVTVRASAAPGANVTLTVLVF